MLDPTCAVASRSTPEPQTSENNPWSLGEQHRARPLRAGDRANRDQWSGDNLPFTTLVMDDILIVGSGLFGAVFARQCLDAGKSVRVLERRDHVAGNCHTKVIDGIIRHVYGAHIFHTNDRRIWNYVQRFGSFNAFINRPKVNYRGKIFSFPINLFTLYQLWGVTTPEEAHVRLAAERVPITDPKNLEEWMLSQVGEEIYQTFIYGYTKKQWMREPRDLHACIVKRLPIRTSFDDSYFTDCYQGVPEQGYTALIENMLDGARVELGVDYFHDRARWNARARLVVYTGCIDRFFDYQYGRLEYRTLRFSTRRLNIPDYQGNAVINYTEEEIPYTRIIEHKHFLGATTAHTDITHEYPVAWEHGSEPYYPISDDVNMDMYRRYARIANKEKGFIFGGRMAQYRYYDMHQVIASALKASSRFLETER